jgi:two-component system, OmpR family, response regulator
MEGKMTTIVSDYAPPKRILYVEENDDSREMLVLTLEQAGYAVSTAGSVADGLSLISRERFDLYILDNSYSDSRVLNLCRQIRADDPMIPIIFYSSSAYPSDIKAGMAAGAQDYLIQPMGIYTITQTIAGLLTSPASAQEPAY